MGKFADVENIAREGYIHPERAGVPGLGWHVGAGPAERTSETTEDISADKGKDQMTQFSDREKAFENKFQKDQEVRFKVTARRNKLLGLWAAGKMGLQGSTAEAYAKDVVAADFEAPGDQDVLKKVLKDLTGKGIDISEHGVRREMDRLLDQAKKEIAGES